jgi:hypothetical protein
MKLRNKNALIGGFTIYGFINCLIGLLDMVGRWESAKTINDGLSNAFKLKYIEVNWTSINFLIFCISLCFLIAINWDTIAQYKKRNKRSWDMLLLDAIIYIADESYLGKSFDHKDVIKWDLSTKAFIESASKGKILVAGKVPDTQSLILIPRYKFWCGEVSIVRDKNGKSKSTNLVKNKDVLYNDLYVDNNEVLDVWPQCPTATSWME